MVGSRDFTRMCQMCGTNWLLPRAWAIEKAPSESQVRQMQRGTKDTIGRALLGARASALSPRRERYAVQATALQATRDRVLNNARCPSCGSTSYKQYKPGEPVPARAPVQQSLGPAQTVQARGAPPQPSTAHELTELVGLRDRGVLTAEEFEIIKRRLVTNGAMQPTGHRARPFEPQPPTPTPTGALNATTPVPKAHPPAWYRDPSGQHRWRWWDGDTWTEHTQ